MGRDMMRTALVIALVAVFAGVKSQGIQPTYIPEHDMSNGQFAGRDECLAGLKETTKASFHVYAPSKNIKMVSCNKIQFGEILMQAKFSMVFYLTVEGGRDFELPEYRNGNQMEAAQSPAWCNEEKDTCCDAWIWDSSYIRCEYLKAPK